MHDPLVFATTLAMAAGTGALALRCCRRAAERRGWVRRHKAVAAALLLVLWGVMLYGGDKPTPPQPPGPPVLEVYTIELIYHPERDMFVPVLLPLKGYTIIRDGGPDYVEVELPW